MMNNTDESEVAQASYSFPANFGHTQVKWMEWDFATTVNQQIIGAEDIVLTGAPVYLFDASLSSTTTLPTNNTFSLKGRR